MKKSPQPKQDAPGYQRSPTTLSKDGKNFSIDGAKVVDLMADYKRWNLLDANGRVKGG